jgi:hypothetical protein
VKSVQEQRQEFMSILMLVAREVWGELVKRFFKRFWSHRSLFAAPHVGQQRGELTGKITR